MKAFLSHSLSIPECTAELTEFEALLASKLEIEERSEILPFFKRNRNLAAFLGTYVPDISNPDRVANEYDIFGDFACDLAIGDSRSKTYLFVEFEDAKSKSLFVDTGRATPDWSPRVEHGISQVIDWFWKLSDMEKSDEYEHRFGDRHVDVHGLVVVGRDQHLETREMTRLRWRQNYTVVNSKRLSVVTFDQMARDLKYRLSMYPAAARADSGN